MVSALAFMLITTVVFRSLHTLPCFIFQFNQTPGDENFLLSLLEKLTAIIVTPFWGADLIAKEVKLLLGMPASVLRLLAQVLAPWLVL